MTLASPLWLIALLAVPALGWLLVREQVTPRMLIATLIILAGLTLTLFGKEMAAWAGRQVGKTARRQVREAA